ncbi:hypothetical protein EOK75_04285 [Pseudorhodobacter turbinis]|uniref:Uncharacterized protein n=1 Tax=Pseudorhodobacter turbinis TaxID=2500533 RepID=A0A4P8EEA7_9RHOB|nr:hypothetical protein EOK75_04285 [Pseudorhodobacter turbinis]
MGNDGAIWFDEAVFLFDADQSERRRQIELRDLAPLDMLDPLLSKARTCPSAVNGSSVSKISELCAARRPFGPWLHSALET